MSLYYDAAAIISSTAEGDSSLKSRVYGSKNLKASPAQVYALISESSKWNEVLNEIVERSQLLKSERKLTPALSVLLMHDLLLAKKGIAAPASHALRVAVERHKARLQAELTKARLRRGCASLDALRQQLQSAVPGAKVQDATSGTTNGLSKHGHPRWIRVNTLKSSLKKQLKITLADFEQVSTLKEILISEGQGSTSKLLHVDLHVPDLVAVPSGVDLTSSEAYQEGEIIFQDKASCFPAYLLNPQAEDGDIVDACAAPGNKTTHLAALMRLTGSDSGAKVYACERDKTRALTLQKMTNIAGASSMVSVRTGQDFLKVDPQKEPWSHVGALLLDPSCSGSGIIGREAPAAFVLPKYQDPKVEGKSSKRKRGKNDASAPSVASEILIPDTVKEEVPDEVENKQGLQARLKSLSAFQTKIVRHAMSFPAARKIVYSTCSLHDEENEAVVLAALHSSIAESGGWRILRRDEQVHGMLSWNSRGRPEACGKGSDAKVIADACIRCSKFTEDGTQGFFVAAFTRGIASSGTDLSDEEWAGFGDEGG